MPVSLCKPSLAFQVMSLLKDHGPSTIDFLHRLTEPQAPKRNLRQSLGILKEKGLVESASLDPQKTFYYLSQSYVSREEIAEHLHTTESDLIQPLLRKQDWFHNQWCEYWIHLIKKQFPDAKIIRERNIVESEHAKETLLIDARDHELMPDFLFSLPKNGCETWAPNIAFEIERTRKSDKRLVRKLKKYFTETRIDGLIYVCDSGRLSETIRALYEEKLVGKRVTRVSHYENYFLLLSDCLAGGGPELPRLFNIKGERISFSNWCNFLTALNDQRDLWRNKSTVSSSPYELLRKE